MVRRLHGWYMKASRPCTPIGCAPRYGVPLRPPVSLLSSFRSLSFAGTHCKSSPSPQVSTCLLLLLYYDYDYYCCLEHTHNRREKQHTQELDLTFHLRVVNSEKEDPFRNFPTTSVVVGAKNGKPTDNNSVAVVVLLLGWYPRGGGDPPTVVVGGAG